MFALIIPIGALLFGMALLLMGSGLLNTLLALRGNIEGYNDSIIGLIMSGYFIGFFIGTYLALPLINRIGHIRTFALCAALISSVCLLHILFVNPYVWILLRIITGVFLVTLYTVIESWLNGQTSSQHRGKVFSIYMIVNLSSIALAQSLLRLDTPSSYVLFALSSILITVSLVPVTWTRLAQPKLSKVPRLKLSKIYSVAPIALVGSAFSGLAMGGFWGMAAIYANHAGLDKNGIATFMTYAILGGVICQYPMGRYSDRHDRRKVLAFISFFASGTAILLALLSYSGLWILLGIALYCGFAFTIYPVAVAHLIDHLDSDNILSGVSTLLLLYGIGAAVGPALAGHLMYIIGYQALPFYFFVTQLILTLYILKKIHIDTEKPEENIAKFVPMVRTTPAALKMLPDEQTESVNG